MPRSPALPLKLNSQTKSHCALTKRPQAAGAHVAVTASAPPPAPAVPSGLSKSCKATFLFCLLPEHMAPACRAVW